MSCDVLLESVCTHRRYPAKAEPCFWPRAEVVCEACLSVYTGFGSVWPAKPFPTLLIGQADIKEKNILVNPMVVTVGPPHTAQEWAKVSGEPWRNSIGRAHLSHTAWPLGGRGRLRLLLRPHEQTAPSGGSTAELAGFPKAGPGLQNHFVLPWLCFPHSLKQFHFILCTLSRNVFIPPPLRD